MSDQESASPATFQVQQPKHFSFKKPVEWPKWRRRFEQFRKASGLIRQPADQQVSMLLYCLGEDAEDVLISTNIREDQRDSYDSVLQHFDDFFKVRKNVIFERAKFNSRSQGEGESVEEFITALYQLVETCDYGLMKEEMLRDRIVVGIRDRALSEKLQMDSELTLEKAKKAARQKEAVNDQHKQMQGGQETTLAAIKRRPSHPRRGGLHQHKQATPSGNPRGASKAKQCKRCGRGQHPLDRCPARDAICHKCNHKGHFASQCLTKSTTGTDEVTLDTAFVGAVSTNQKCWQATLAVEGVDVDFKLDTGAEVTAISSETYQICREPLLEPATKIVLGPA